MVFTDTECVKYFEENFIFYKLINGEGELDELRKKWKIPGFPTIMMFDANGEEIDRMIGFDDNKDNFMNTIKNWAAGKLTLKSLLVQYEKNPKDIYLIHQLASKYIRRHETDKAMEYYNIILEKDPKDEAGFHEESYFYKSKQTLWNDKNSKPLEKILSKTSNKKFIVEGYNNLLNFHYGNKDPEEKFSLFNDAIKKMPENTDFMNQYAWYIFTKKVESKYDEAIKITQDAIAIDSKDDNLFDTLAHLYFVSGNKEKAINTIEKAIVMNPESKYYKEELAKFKQ